MEGVTAGNAAAAESPAGDAGRRNDAFEAGQWWKNRGAGGREESAAGIRQCRCRSCPACAAQAYRDQAPAKGAVSASDAGRSGQEAAALPGGRGQEGQGAVAASQEEQGEAPGSPAEPKSVDGDVLNQAEKLLIAKLKRADTAVKAHELAHLSVAGPYATSGINFSYQRGPDGQRYAVGGEVQIDTTAEATPEATIAKMQVVRAAALAPADPSPQDRKVAAAATAKITAANRELREIREQDAELTRQAKADGEGGDSGKKAGDAASGPHPSGAAPGDGAPTTGSGPVSAAAGKIYSEPAGQIPGQRVRATA